MQLNRIARTLCGVGILAGLLACLPATALADEVPVRTLTYRLVDDEPAQVENVSFRQFGFYGHGYGFRPRGGFSLSLGFAPRYYGHSYYRPYRSYYGSPFYGYSYYRPSIYGFSYYRPRHYAYSYYNPSIYGYAYHRPLYHRPYYGSYYSGYSGYLGYSPGYSPRYFGASYDCGSLYHGSFGYGSACCY